MRYKSLLNEYFRRFHSQGFLPGDLVKFKSDAAEHPYTKSSSELYQKAVSELTNSKSPLQLVKFLEDKPTNPNLYGLYAVVAPEIGPQMYGQETFVIPTDLLELYIVSHNVANSDPSKFISDTTGKFKGKETSKGA